MGHALQPSQMNNKTIDVLIIHWNHKTIAIEIYSL